MRGEEIEEEDRELRRWKECLCPITTAAPCTRVIDPTKTPHTMEARPQLLLVVVAISVSISAGGATVINVKSYGAQGNGASDDSKVGAFFLRL